MIYLPKPCPVKWESMTAADGGRDCSICQKVIPDFTGKTNDEIMEAVRNGVSCGRFSPDQITDGSTYGSWKHFPGWKTGVAMLVSGSMFFASCHSKPERHTHGMIYTTPQYQKTTKGKYGRKGKKPRGNLKWLTHNASQHNNDTSS
jgi:hypothetical protein